MARKKLLTEGEIRQFMKLANLRPIGQDRLSEYGGLPMGDRELDDDGADIAAMDDMDAAMEDEDDAALDMDDAMADAEVKLSDEDAAAIAAAAPAMQKVADAVSGGDEMADMAMDDADIDMSDAMDDEEVDPMMEMESAAAAMRAKRDKRAIAAPGRGEFGTPDPDAPPIVDPAGAGKGKGEKVRRRSGAPKTASAAYRGKQNESVDHDAIVNEVVNRVRARMQAQQESANRKEVLADQLAERIMKRLTK